jgi:hypothetical protein
MSDLWDSSDFASKRGRHGDIFTLKKRWFPLALKKYKVTEVSHSAP